MVNSGVAGGEEGKWHTTLGASHFAVY